MKLFNVTKTIALLAVAAMLFAGCSKDKEVSNEGTYTFDGKDLSLSQAFSEDWGIISTGMYKQKLNLVSKGLSYDFTEYTYLGTGNRIVLTLIGSQDKFPGVGTYTYNPTLNYVLNSIDYGYFYENYVATTGESDYTHL